MPPDLIRELNNIITSQNLNEYAGFFIKSHYVWNEKPLKYGLKNNKIVLLHKRRMHYPIIDDLDCTIMGEIEGHYQPTPKKSYYKIGQLKTKTTHHAFTSQDDWLKRHQKYAAWEAHMIKKKAYPKDPSIIRELVKRLFRQLPNRSLIAFLHSYILKLGFLDGKPGRLFAKTRYDYYKMVQSTLQSPK